MLTISKQKSCRNSRFYLLALASLIAIPSASSADFHKQLLRDVGRAIIIDQLQNGGSNNNSQAQRPATTQQAAPVNPAAAAEPQMSRDTRRQVQTALNTLGFNVGAADGILGRGSRAGIRQWQAAKGFNATGYLTSAQLQSLRSVQTAQATTPQSSAPSGTTSNNLTEAQVAQLQIHLQTLGHYNGPINGQPSRNFGVAVQSFLSSKGFDANAVAPVFALDLADATVRGAPPPPVILATPTAPQITSAAPVQLTRAETRQLQESLQALGFYRGAIDGIAGGGTSSATIQFLASQGYAADAVSPTFTMQLARAVSTGAPLPTPETGTVTANQSGNGAITAAAEPAIASVPAGPVPLDGRVIVPFSGFFDESDHIAIAALQRMPEFARTTIVRNLMSSQRLKRFVQYGDDAWQSDAEITRISQAVADLSIPNLNKISIAVPASFRDVLVAATKSPEGGTEPITAGIHLTGGNLLAEFTTIDSVRGSNIKVVTELSGLPNLKSVTLSPSELDKYRAGPGAMPQYGTVYIHLDVTRFDADETSNNLVLSGDVVGVDYYGRIGRTVDETYIYSFPLGKAEDEAPSTGGYRALIATLLDDMRQTQNVRNEPQFIGDALDLRTAGYSINVLEMVYLSAALKLRPDLLEDDAFAVDLAPRLLTLPDRLRAFRGTALNQPGMLANFNGWYRNLDPFERRDVADRIRSEMRETLIGRTMNEPVEAVAVFQTQLGEYDFDAQAFPLRPFVGNRNIAGVGQGEILPGAMYQYANNYVNPPVLEMEQDQAREFLRSFPESRNLSAFVGIHLTLPALTNVKSMAEFDRDVSRRDRVDQLFAEVSRVVLYADQGLTAPIYEFDSSDFLVTAEVVGGLTAYDVVEQELATAEALIGYAMTVEGGMPDDVLDMIAQRTPSFSIVQPDKRAEYTQIIADRYRALSNEDGHWVAASVALENPDPIGRTFDLVIGPSFYGLARNNEIESANVRINEYYEPSLVTRRPQGLQIDDRLLEHNQSFLANYRNDGGLAATMNRMNGVVITGPQAPGSAYQAFVRIKPTVSGFEGGSSPYLSLSPEVVEYYLLFGNRNDPADFRILAHENLETGAAVEQVVAATELTASDIIVVRKAGSSESEPSGLVYSCVEQGELPVEFDKLNPIALPVGTAEAVPMFVNLIDVSGIWVTRAECLRDGLLANSEDTNVTDKLVYRATNSETFDAAAELAARLGTEN